MIVRSWQSAIRWAVGTAGSLLAILGLGFANELWSARDDVLTLKAEKASDHELLMEMRQDIKDILLRLGAK